MVLLRKAILVLALGGASVSLSGAMLTATQTASVTLQPQAKLMVAGAPDLTRSGLAFSPYTGKVSVWFRARTLPGSATRLTLQATSKFTPLGGPDLDAGELTFTCSLPSYGMACSGLNVVSYLTAVTVVTLPASACTGGGGPCSSSDPASIDVNLLLENSPAAATGTYSVQLQFNFSDL
jgi:hypothetical protein